MVCLLTYVTIYELLTKVPLPCIGKNCLWSSMMREILLKSIRVDSMKVDFPGGGGVTDLQSSGTTVTHRKGMFHKMLYGILPNVLLSFIWFYWSFSIWIYTVFWYISVTSREERSVSECTKWCRLCLKCDFCSKVTQLKQVLYGPISRRMLHIS